MMCFYKFISHVFFIFFFSSITLSASAQITRTQVFTVASGSDDAEEAAPGGSGTVGAMDLTSSDLEIMLDGTKRQFIGIRFTNVTIPQGATLQRAYLQFANKGDKAPVLGDAVITAQDIDNAATFTSTAFNVSTRTQLATTVTWTGSTSTTWGTTAAGAAGADQRTPDIKTLIQPVINRGGWASGNALVLILSGNGLRNAFSYDGAAANAPKLIVEYTSGSTPSMAVTNFPIAQNSEWKYLDNGTDQGTAWTATPFNDLAWSYGPGKFGYSDNPTTTLGFGPSSSNKYITYYFRKQFTVTNVSALLDSLKLSILRDDGAVVYINGTEVVRSNMSAGAVNYLTFSSTIVDGADESAYFSYHIPKTVLVNGTNTIAVELHQRDGTSSDLGFDLTLSEYTPTVAGITVFPVPANSQWKYLDNGTDQGTAWSAPSFNDATWSSGNGKLGYADNATTTLSYGPDANNKYITYYFRKKFKITNLALLTDTVELKLLRDDGALVYINGTEVVRSNMPAGSINYQTFSSTIVDGADESTYFSYLLPKTLLVNDTNTIAVEIHQRDGTSSDLGFDLSLTGYTTPIAPVVCTPLISNHISNFVSVLPSAQPDSLRIPSTHTFQMLLQSGDPYTNVADGLTKSTFDFTGYVPINGSSANGYLSINHEEGSWPAAGVSMLSLNYSAPSRLWNVTNNVPVDFGVVAGTGRNCSGTVTPWGTIVTCEETLPTSDVNLDGYQDIGWAVEINPVTHAVVDHDNNGAPDKLWSLGRMSHENIVVSQDSLTAYEGNDENPGYIFKLVANSKMQLGTGTLYVLKMTGTPDNSTAGEWIVVPNSTPTECNNVRAFAASVSATNFNSIEDVEISPLDGKIYFTSKASSRVYRFKDNGTTVNQFDIFVGNAASLYSITYDGGTASEQWRDGNDNLTFDDQGNLYVIQDGGRNHIWMVKPCHTAAAPAVELFAVTPAGCEPTGMTFSPDYKFMFVSMQHPSAANLTQMRDAAGNLIRFNKESAIVIARKEFLGAAAGPLPVSFISFNASKNRNNGVDIDWQYHSDESGVKFELQRMTDGGSFETVYTYTSNITGNSKHNYVDGFPAAGKNYYRIKATQRNGKEILTNIKVVNIESKNIALIKTYPNPVNNEFTIIVGSRAANTAQVKVFTASGAAAVLQQAQKLVSGNNTIALNTQALAAGVYIVHVIAGDETLQAKFVKQ